MKNFKDIFYTIYSIQHTKYLLMKLFITLMSHKGKVEAWEEDKIIASREFSVDKDLSQKLLTEIDALFLGIKKLPTDISGVEYSAIDAGFTTTRIGQVVADTYNFAVRKDR